MIVDGPLSRERQAISRKNYNIFNSINGLSYMCLGETVIILLAVKLNFPDAFIACLGAMLYFGYLLLPLGRTVTARVGAARSQAIFWVLRNFAALAVAGSAVVALTAGAAPAMAMLLAGAFMFYGFRAAGVVMSQPLFGDITAEDNRAGFLATNAGLFYAAALAGLAVISLLLRWNDSLAMLSVIIVVGALLGFTSSRFLRKIDETNRIRASARRPLLPELARAWRKPVLRRLIAAGFVVNLGVIMLVPNSMLALKRGYGVGDGDALFFAMAQMLAAAFFSLVSGRVAAAVGPRKALMIAYLALLAVGVWWIVAPDQLIWPWAMLPFVLAGAASVIMNNSLTHYFLQKVSPHSQVASSMFVSMVNGSGACLAGMLLAGTLLALATGSAEAAGPASPAGYRTYFLAATALLALGLPVIARLRPLPLEKRRIRKSWSLEN